MNYQLDVTCPRCGTQPQHLTNSPPTPPITLQTRTVIHCPQCLIDYLIIVELRPARPETERPTGGMYPCGTEAAYKRHLRRNESTCAPCREAHRVYIAARTPNGARHGKKVPAA